MSRHLQGKGLFHSGNLSTVLLPELHITPFEKIKVPKRGIKPNLPVGSSDCNGNISRVRSRYKSAGFPLLLDILRKHRHLFGTGMVPWTFASIKI